MRMKKNADRAERLARQLIKLYKCVVKVYKDNVFLPRDKKILVKPSSSCIFWGDVLYPYGQVLAFTDWNEVLFGSHNAMSLTDAIKLNASSDCNKASQNRLKLLLDFKTLDELDILLTLAGCNRVSVTSRS